MRRTRILLAPLIAAALIPATAAAAPGDPHVVYTANSFTTGAVILRTDPASGALVEVSRNGAQGTLFQRPYDLAVERDGNLVVADLGVPDLKDGAVIRVDPLTGRQSLVSSGGEFFDPAGIAVAPDGRLYVVDNRAPDNDGAVIAVDPRTGEQTLVTQGNQLDLPFGIAIERSGSLVVTNRLQRGEPGAGCLPLGRVVRVDPASGAQQLVAQGLVLGDIAWPLGVAIAPDGGIVVANECAGGAGLVRVDPFAGLQIDLTWNSPQDVLETPERMAFDPGGALLVSDYNVGPDGDGGIVRVDPDTGAQTLVRAGELFNHPLGIAAVVNRPPTAALAVNPTVVAAGNPVRLDASRSSDPEGLALAYEWDLDGDGGFETGSGAIATASRSFGHHGPATVRVRVNDPHGGRAVAEAGIAVDGAMPLITGLRIGSRVLGVGPRRGRAAATARRRPPRATRVRFNLSEPATVRLLVERARRGRRPAPGAGCRVRARRGPRCLRWSRARVIRHAGAAGANAVRLRARGLRQGRYRVALRAVDAVGNRSSRRVLPLRVVRLRDR
jgi:DNA-binding beta-propeller fold protein YncE